MACEIEFGPDDLTGGSRYAAILLAAATILCLIPWLNRGFDIDEPLFLWSAEQILRDPLDFYGGQLNWYGTDLRFCDVIKNPPLNAYYLAAVGALTGFGEVPLHLAMLVWSVALIVGTYCLAARLCDRPALAAAVTLATPACLVSSLSVMCDVPMVALWVWALFFWLRGVDDRRPVSLAIACCLMAICALTKYFGVALVPLALVYGLAQRRNIGGWMAWLVIPLGVSAAFEVYLRDKYGTGAFLDAAGYARTAVAGNALGFFGRGYITLLFTGGSLLPVLLFAPLVWSQRQLFAWAAIGLATGCTLVVAGEIVTGNAENYPLRTNAGVHWGTLLQTICLTLAALQLLALVVLDVWSKRDAVALLLALWVFGTLLFAGWFNWSISVRSILPAAPAAAMLIARRLQLRTRHARAVDSRRATWSDWLPLPLALAIALALGWADYRSANANRAAARVLISRYSRHVTGSDLWFCGHWGLQYYLQQAGAKPINLHGSDVYEGSVIVVPDDNPGGVEVPENWNLRETIEEPLAGWLTTISLDEQVSFYSSVLGPVPFYFGAVPPRQFRVYDPFQIGGSRR